MCHFDFFPGILFPLLQLKWKLSELVCSLDSLWYVSGILYKRLFCEGFSQCCCFEGKERKCDNWSLIPALSFNPRFNLIQWSIQETNSNWLGGRVWRREGVNKDWGLLTSAKCGAILLFKQPEDGINFPYRTRIQSEKAQAYKVEGHAAEDQKEMWTCSTWIWWIDHNGSVHVKYKYRLSFINLVSMKEEGSGGGGGGSGCGGRGGGGVLGA